MSEKLRYSPSVPHDIAEALKYYSEISPTIDDRFTESLENCFMQIAAFPEHRAIAFSDVRISRIKIFPYLVLYRVRNDVVEVIAVFHSAVSPKRWNDRAGDDQ
ncbi:MAG: type II toxin-antitoxin system RelE/ParE family toxin [Planctomycetota bacterium]